MCPELILWDWNGTLLDDVDLCVDALNRLLAGFGYPQRYDHERYRAIFGFPIEEYYVRAGFDFTKHSFAELAEKYMEDYVPASAACPLADGAIDALEAFKAAGVRLIVVLYSFTHDTIIHPHRGSCQTCAGVFRNIFNFSVLRSFIKKNPHRISPARNSRMGTSQVESIPSRVNRYCPIQPETPQHAAPPIVKAEPFMRSDIVLLLCCRGRCSHRPAS